jgi:HK97 family phage major capsid protein
MSKIQEVKDKLQDSLTEARQIVDKAEEAKRDLDSGERKQIQKYLADAREAKNRLKELAGDEALIQAVKDLGDGIELAPERPQQKAVSGARGESLSDMFVNSDGWKSFMKRVAPNGKIPDSMKGISSPPVELKHGLSTILGRKELLTGTSDVSAGAFVESDRTGIYEPIGRHMLTMRDIINARTTGSDTVEFVRQTLQVTQAAPAPEANVTTYEGATGEVSGEKPEGTMRFERVSESVKTIAVWIPATKRALADAGQLRGIIEQELREDVSEELENQMITGNGTGENLAGLENTANVLVQAHVTDELVTARKAITHLLVTGKQRPTAWMIHPVDWETIELLKDQEGRYRWGGPIARGPATLWGVPVVQSFFQTQGKAWLANWSKIVLWDRQQTTLAVSDSHADFFIRNMVAFLAELRAAFGVIRPSGVVEVDLAGGS